MRPSVGGRPGARGPGSLVPLHTALFVYMIIRITQYCSNDVTDLTKLRGRVLIITPQLPSQPLKGLLPSLLGEQRHDGCEQFA